MVYAFYSKNPRFLLKILAVFLLVMTLNACKSKRPIGEPKSEQPKELKTHDTISPESGDTLVRVDSEKVIDTIEAGSFSGVRPYAKREFRAAWIATVANINWPSKPGLPVAEQKKEALELLDFLEKHNFNAVIFQVRPQADALYKSELEPWSYFLTGQQGQGPNPDYDPLEFWIEAAHARGLELHAWLNPYRAQHSTGGAISGQSVIKKNPEMVVKLKNGMYWMDPANEETKKHSTAVVMDLIDRYDLDGIHFDDYFYPYDSYNGGEDFPDDISWDAYKKNGGKLTRNDWRRESVNDFIKNLYQQIKAKKPEVKFGISPFGIWRPGFPESVKGFDQYDKLYADARLWLKKGWVDYFTPQLYWQISQLDQSFPVLLGWWKSQNDKNRHLWPGMSVDLGGDEANIKEVISQIMVTRGMMPYSPGAVHWSIAPLLKYKSLADALLEGPYADKALVPQSSWLDEVAPSAPKITTRLENDKLKIDWTPTGNKEVFKWVVYFKTNGNWNNIILNKNSRSIEIEHLDEKAAKKITSMAVTAISRMGEESEFKEIDFSEIK